MNGSVTGLMRRLRMAPDKLTKYRDIALGIPVVVGTILAAGPLFSLFGHERISTGELEAAAIGLGLAVVLSLLSPNWNQLLAAGWLFLAFRSLIALLISRDPHMLLFGAVFLGIGVACLALKRRGRS